MKTRSNGKQGKSPKLTSRRERVKAAKAELSLLKKAKEIPPPSEKEQKVLDILWRNFEESDAAAKAAARFEKDIHTKIVDERLHAGLPEDEAGDIGRVFSSSEFNSTFQKLMKLKVEAELIDLLGLDEYKDEIMSRVIMQILDVDTSASVQQKEQRIRIGKPEAQLLMYLKNKVLTG